MKQIIVLASFIALGIFISGIVLGFRDDISVLGTKTTSSINKIVDEMPL